MFLISLFPSLGVYPTSASLFNTYLERIFKKKFTWLFFNIFSSTWRLIHCSTLVRTLPITYFTLRLVALCNGFSNGLLFKCNLTKFFKTFAYTKTRNSWNVFAGKDISHKGGHCNCLLIIRSGESIPPAAASIEQNSQSQSVNGGHFSLLSRQILITKQKWPVMLQSSLTIFIPKSHLPKNLWSINHGGKSLP